MDFTLTKTAVLDVLKAQRADMQKVRKGVLEIIRRKDQRWERTFRERRQYDLLNSQISDISREINDIENGLDSNSR